MKSNCCIVIINHTEHLSNDERRSIDKAIEVFGGKRNIFIVLPDNINTSEYEIYFDKSKILKVDSEWLSNYKNYNKTLCSSFFYKLFTDYEYVLIYQTDCWVFEDKLDEFIKLGYDWYGAPWPMYDYAVGNGGLSLRKVSKMIEITSNFTYDGRLNEDGWFCLTHKDKLNICPWEIAVNFSLEIVSKKLLNNIKKTPMGFHGKHLISIWDETGEKFIEFKKNNTKISIITINFNNRFGLEKTIESVVNQTNYKQIEYIIIDGGSVDGSMDIVQKYEDKIDYYTSEKDNGLYDAMNKGIKHATGDYCIFLNSGDYFCSSTVIEEALPNLTEDIVYGDLMINAKKLKKYVDTIPSNYFEYESLPHPSTFIKTSLLKNGGYSTDYKIISDWIFFREYIIEAKKTYKHINIPISNFFLGGASSNISKINEEKNKYYNELKYDYKLCIVMPCYNYGNYISEALDSIKNSTYSDFHCIIVNDGSTDNSEEIILKNIKDDKRFEYFKNENHGVGYARNFGISKTNSKYILCLDPDDKISPTYIENAIKYLDENPNTSLYYGKAKMFYDDGKEYVWNLPEFNYIKLLKTNQIYSSCVYRRKDYNRCGGYDEKMTGYEDWDFLIRLLYNNSNVHMTDDIVFYYRRHEGSMDKQEKPNFKKHYAHIVVKNIKIYENCGYNVKIIK